MKKILLVGAMTLAVSAIAGSALASPNDLKEASTPAVETTPAIEATPEELEAREVESIPTAELTPSVEATTK